MKSISTFVFLLLLTPLLQAQTLSQAELEDQLNKPLELYINCDGNYSSYSGSAAHTTGKEASGSVAITTTGPVKYTISQAPAIGPNEKKKWTGSIFPDTTQSPAPGKMVKAKITGKWVTHYTRPSGTGDPEAWASIDSTFDCGGFCYYHGTDDDPDFNKAAHKNQHDNDITHEHSGMHDYMSGKGTEEIEVHIYRMKVGINGPDSVCQGDKVKLTAVTYPDGGSYSWPDGSTNKSYEFTASKTGNFTLKYTIKGLTCEASHHLFVADTGKWKKKDYEVPEKYTKPLTTAIEKVVNNIPGGPKITVDGPKIKFEIKQRDCCDEGETKPDADIEGNGSIAVGLKAEDIPLGTPPWTGSFKKSATIGALVFEIKGKYGAFLDVSANMSGKLGYRKNDCIPEDCLFGSIDMSFEPAFKVSVEGLIAVKKKSGNSVQCKGKTKSGAQCKLKTLYVCKHCHLHLDQGGWYCKLTSTKYKLDLIKVSTKISGTIAYNIPKCSSGLSYKIDMGGVNLDLQVPPMSKPYTIKIAPPFNLITHP